MADTLPRRTKTSSSDFVAENQTTNIRDSEATRQKTPVTPTRTRTGRRITLSHKKLVFYDPVAFRYLEEDDSTIVLARRERLQGYEMYIVEQWACSRIHPTFAIATYTGDPSHSILVNVLAVPRDEENWSKRLKIYLDAVSQFHAREQETHLGTLMATNLSAFPSALTVISVPDGDVRKHREDFIVNENLKKMGCTGRAAMNLQPAPPSTMAKFHHLYQTSESVPFKTSVMELVKICQTALVLFGKLSSIYADGLLCDITEKAINDWWNEIGTDFHNVEPSDGILGPTTVSALVGLMIGAYNRIRSTGINVPKDILDVESMKRAIGHFQKGYKVYKTRRLDRETLDRLHRVTAKTANSEGWGVSRAVKSTVAELSGKGGEMVMGVVGANKDKVGISEVETLEIDKLSQLVPGAKMRWLWQGKPMKSSRVDYSRNQDDEGLNGRVFSTDERGNLGWISGHRESGIDNEDIDEASNHDRSGLGRLRGAVLRSHHMRGSKRNEDEAEKDEGANEASTARMSKDYFRPVDRVLTSTSSFHGQNSLDKQLTDRPAFGLALASADAHAPGSPQKTRSRLQTASSADGNHEVFSHREQLKAANKPTRENSGRKRVRAELRHLHEQVQEEVYQKFATEFDGRQPDTPTLRRTRSALLLDEVEPPDTFTLRVPHQSLKLPRQLSFSLVESSILKYNTVQDDMAQDDHSQQYKRPLSKQKSLQEIEARELQQLTAQLIQLEQNLLLYADAEVLDLGRLDQKSREGLNELNNVYFQRLDEYQSYQASSKDLVAREKASLDDGLKRIDMLGQKLDYELDALDSRMEEVEDGAAEFERNVSEIEARVQELVNDRQSLATEQMQQIGDKPGSWLQRVAQIFGSSE